MREQSCLFPLVRVKIFGSVSSRDRWSVFNLCREKGSSRLLHVSCAMQAEPNSTGSTRGPTNFCYLQHLVEHNFWNCQRPGSQRGRTRHRASLHRVSSASYRKFFALRCSVRRRWWWRWRWMPGERLERRYRGSFDAVIASLYCGW